MKKMKRLAICYLFIGFSISCSKLEDVTIANEETSPYQSRSLTTNFGLEEEDIGTGQQLNCSDYVFRHFRYDGVDQNGYVVLSWQFDELDCTHQPICIPPPPGHIMYDVQYSVHRLDNILIGLEDTIQTLNEIFSHGSTERDIKFKNPRVSGERRLYRIKFSCDSNWSDWVEVPWSS